MKPTHYWKRGFVTLCEKDMARVKWTGERDKVTCGKCKKLMEEYKL